MTYDLLRLHQICSWYCIDLVMIQIHFDCKQKLALTSFLNGQTRPLFCLFLLFSHVANTNTYGINLTINDKSVYCVLWSQTRGGRMESADESTESTTKMVLQQKIANFFNFIFRSKRTRKRFAIHFRLWVHFAIQNFRWILIFIFSVPTHYLSQLKSMHIWSIIHCELHICFYSVAILGVAH